MTIGSRVELIANVCLVAASVMVCFTFGARLWGGTPLLAPNTQTPGYGVGDELPAVSGVRYAQADKTLLLFVSSRCRFCTDSMPFYVKLAAQRGSRSLQMIVLGRESEPVLTEYATKHGLRADRVLRLDSDAFHVAGTPTLILADRRGRVVGHWRGLLRDREREVERALEE